MQVVRSASVLKGFCQEKTKGAELQRRNDIQTGGSGFAAGHGRRLP